MELKIDMEKLRVSTTDGNFNNSSIFLSLEELLLLEESLPEYINILKEQSQIKIKREILSLEKGIENNKERIEKLKKCIL